MQPLTEGTNSQLTSQRATLLHRVALAPLLSLLFLILPTNRGDPPQHNKPHYSFEQSLPVPFRSNLVVQVCVQVIMPYSRQYISQVTQAIALATDQLVGPNQDSPTVYSTWARPDAWDPASTVQAITVPPQDADEPVPTFFSILKILIDRLARGEQGHSEHQFHTHYREER